MPSRRRRTPSLAVPACMGQPLALLGQDPPPGARAATLRRPPTVLRATLRPTALERRQRSAASLIHRMATRRRATPRPTGCDLPIYPTLDPRRDSSPPARSRGPAAPPRRGRAAWTSRTPRVERARRGRAGGVERLPWPYLLAWASLWDSWGRNRRQRPAPGPSDDLRLP